MKNKKPEETKALAKPDPTLSDRFTAMVVKEYSGSVSNVKLNELQRKLAQHLFIKVDIALKDFEAKRLQSGQNKKAPFKWDNINLPKLAIDTVHRIELGLDALIPNHIHPVPYFNGKLGKYDMDLRIGYAGKDYYYRKMSLHKIIDIVYELVHENDSLEVIKKNANNKVESYDLEISDPFDRGAVVGGIGYIMYENPELNRLVIVTIKDFEKSEKAAQSNKFWGAHKEIMQYKTIVHRTVTKIVLDPRKINKSFAHVEHDEIQSIDQHVFEEAQAEAAELGNQEVIDIGEVTPEIEDDTGQEQEDGPSDGMTEEERQEALERDIQESEKERKENEEEGPGF